MAKSFNLTHKVVLVNGLTHGLRFNGKSLIFKKGVPAYVTEDLASTLEGSVNAATQVVGDKVTQVEQPRFTITKLESALSSKDPMRISTKAAAKAKAPVEEEGDEDEDEGEGESGGNIRDR